MDKNIETEFQDQSRWNDVYGKEYLDLLEKNPERFVIDLAKLPKSQLEIINVMSNLENKRILEYGSGRGEFSVALSKLGGVVTGIDLGEDLVEMAKRVAKVNNVECEFVAGSIHHLQFADNTFDFVIGTGILHHLPKQGVTDSISESYRVLKPGGAAVFLEPIENSKTFDFLQNILPVDKPGTPHYRPSILQRDKWVTYLNSLDDRDMTDAEFADAKGRFSDVKFSHYGFLIRLARLFPNATFKKFLERIDSVLTHEASPLKMLSQSVLVVYRK
jgi:2-polyprenyl-3-methyl-5-hydroxy-6-metoxy-1,4-benzoquinol methylase